jgi:4a-hydroxytetrahydrobiopterin dehydratase
MAMAGLKADEREAALKEIGGWRYDAGRDALVRDFRFADFGAAFGFMTRVALLAEKAGHHPEWSNVYDRVTIALRTHDDDGVSEKDIALAKAIDAL